MSVESGTPKAYRDQPVHVLTLTPFYPSKSDDASGCFVAEPLAKTAEQGIVNAVIAVQSIYHHAEVEPSGGAPAATWIGYPALPSGIGLSTAGIFLFSRILHRVRDLHRTKPVDVIHAHAPLPCGHAAMLLSKEMGIPYVVSVHGLDAYSDIQVKGRAGQWCRRITGAVYRSASCVICVSEEVRKKVLAPLQNLANTTVVYNGVDPELFYGQAEETCAPPILLSIGNLIPTKGHAILLKALGALQREHPQVACEIVGTGPEKARLEQMAADLDLKVRFRGRFSRYDVAEAFRSCTLFVLPSYFEGLGCVYLEAMASERVAIGCKRQGIEEIIRHGANGWLVEPESVDELASAISRLLSDHLLRNAIAKAGRRTCLEGLTLLDQAKRFAAIYREVAR